MSRSSEISSLRDFVLPYDGSVCTKRDHAIGRTISGDDTRLHACDCGCAMVGNGRVEIRFGLIPLRFPDA
jgi:hypothetical protein